MVNVSFIFGFGIIYCMFSNLANMEMLIIKLLLVSRQLNYIINYHIDRGGNQSSRQALF